ncbi:riboflavin biosynthesis protein RibD [Lactococcus plantarum]|uniref:Riboflavin biosynthesis protein RibD n=1 Tax=Pseudolactococcus plantarum TaxID=1365 RepID=A0A2A5S0X6_9LACT|nr:riboflavin biosynthesis protein RibD [Lactococcus plantarum]
MGFLYVPKGGDLKEEKYMSLALQLAKQGSGWVNPNPLVGAVIVKNGRVIGKGYHRRYGDPHAEREALANCLSSPVGATLYVTLTPCCHQGKTPPCTEAIIQSGISRVVIGSADPNPLVGEKSLGLLANHGIEVVTGVLKSACDAINQGFFHYIQSLTPYVVMKYAMTMDGKIATVTGASKWITGEVARTKVHEDRQLYAAIMVGIGTILADDPSLTCRLADAHQPVRIICDSTLKTPRKARVVQTAKEVPTIIATCVTDRLRIAPYLKSGCQVVTLPKTEQGVDLNALMTYLGERQIDSVLLEGGQALNGAALEAQIVHRVQTYIAPIIFGGVTAKSPIGGRGVMLPSEAYHLSKPTVTRLGGDILLESEVQYVHGTH